MREPPFQVGDKVTLLPEWKSVVYTTPALKPGWVYCVEKVNVAYNNYWVRLMGVRENKSKCYDDRGVMHIALARVNPAGSNRREAR